MGLVNTEFAAMSQGNDKSALDKINAFLDDESSKIGEIFKMLHDKTGVPKICLAGGIAALLVVLILFCFGAPLLCNVVGFIYPAYASFKSLDSKRTDDDRQWLTYWVVYCCFSLIEGFLEYVLFWVPFYYPIKLAFLFYLSSPRPRVRCRFIPSSSSPSSTHTWQSSMVLHLPSPTRLTLQQQQSTVRRKALKRI